jgi:Protein of unknown function (DUF3987)
VAQVPGKAGREGDREFYLESWNGTDGYDVDRIGRGSLHVPALCLSFLGGIQPGKIAAYVYGAMQADSGSDDGLLQRFQLLIWPDSVPWRKVDQWPDTEAKNRAYGVLKGLAALTPEQCGAVALTTADEVPALHFDDAAQAVFDAWRDKLESRLRSGEIAPALESHLAKYRSLMPSLALIFHLMDVVDGSAVDTSLVGLICADRAAAWCEYLESHARRLYASATNPSLERARALIKHLEAGDVADGATLRDIYRHHWEKLDGEEEAADAVKTLDAYGWVRLDKLTDTGGRPSHVIRLHPTLCAGKS